MRVSGGQGPRQSGGKRLWRVAVFTRHLLLVATLAELFPPTFCHKLVYSSDLLVINRRI